MRKVSHVVLPFSTLSSSRRYRVESWNSCDMPQFISLHIIVPLKWQTYVNACIQNKFSPHSATLFLPPSRRSGLATRANYVNSLNPTENLIRLLRHVLRIALHLRPTAKLNINESKHNISNELDDLSTSKSK